MNSTLAHSLRAYCQENPSSWDQILPNVWMTFRMSPTTQSKGYSPYHMLFGEEMPLPIYVALWPNELLDKAPSVYVENLVKKRLSKKLRKKM